MKISLWLALLAAVISSCSNTAQANDAVNACAAFTNFDDCVFESVDLDTQCKMVLDRDTCKCPRRRVHVNLENCVGDSGKEVLGLKPKRSGGCSRRTHHPGMRYMRVFGVFAALFDVYENERRDSASFVFQPVRVEPLCADAACLHDPRAQLSAIASHRNAGRRAFLLFSAATACPASSTNAWCSIPTAINVYSTCSLRYTR